MIEKREPKLSRLFGRKQNNPEDVARIAELEELAATKVPAKLVNNIEMIVEIGKKTNLDESFYFYAKKFICFVARKLKITNKEAALFSLLVERPEHFLTASDISNCYGCSILRVMTYTQLIDSLVTKKLVLKQRGRKSEAFQVPSYVMTAILENKYFDPETLPKATFSQMFSYFDRVFDFRMMDDAEEISDGVEEFLENNRHLDFVKEIKTVFPKYSEYTLLFLYFCHCLYNNDDNMVNCCQWEDFFDRGVSDMLKYELQDGTSPLLQSKLLEPCGESLQSVETFRLTKNAIDRFFNGISGLMQPDRILQTLEDASKYAEKTLFYNESENKKVTQLADLISVDNFSRVQNRLSEKGMRKGFCCLFYGAPGTGKTETVYQLARKTGRKLFIINVSDIKSKWVGESEKNIAETFFKYRQCVAVSRECGKPEPILLFNEADAVLGVRKTGAENAVDKMENSIQNIILQAMECLDGIMIATTNLTSNLDSAFERRFLYKIEFRKPEYEAKKNIWNAMIPGLQQSDLEELAKFDFSGGQIENIARKRDINEVLYGVASSIAQLKEYCQEEVVHDGKANKVGF